MQHDTRYLFLSMTISGVACFLFFRFAYPYHLLHREQMLLFTYTVDQFIDYFNHPAPLSCLGGDFLTQLTYTENGCYFSRLVTKYVVIFSYSLLNRLSIFAFSN